MEQRWHRHSISAAFPNHQDDIRTAAISIIMSNCHIHFITILIRIFVGEGLGITGGPCL
jgi:hypothetical protein